MLKRHGMKKFGEHQRQHWHSQRDADPKPPRHIDKFWIALFGGDLAWFECHAADRATARFGSYDLRMHWARVLGTGGRCVNDSRLKRHATLRTVARTHSFYLCVHRADILRGLLVFGTTGDCRRLGSKILLRIATKLGGTTLTAKMEISILMLNVGCGLRRVDLHPTHRIDSRLDCLS